MTLKQMALAGAVIAVLAGAVGAIPLKWGLGLGSVGLFSGYLLPPQGLN